ncbi:MAG: 3-methyladenine DNA glycosylase [Saprospiraceae bacterium]|nr:3-methyladenine DNA glycosylase [Saprospiraceae bacterium]
MAYKKLKYWFDADLAVKLAAKISVYHAGFPQKEFVEIIETSIPTQELKARVETIADAIHVAFEEDYITAIGALLNILGPINKNETGMFTEYYWLMPVAKYVEKFGLDHFKVSIKAIEEITKRNTGEYAIRPYLEKHTIETLKQMMLWTGHKNSHVRRLASEGLRPRLPWASKMKRFIDDPSPIIPVLNQLKDDPSKYVQKSVANCLNDILKDNPGIGKKVIEAWNISQISTERRWIIKHALRNLIKANDAWALDITARN